MTIKVTVSIILNYEQYSIMITTKELIGNTRKER